MPERNNRFSDLEFSYSYLNSKDPKVREDAYRKLLSFKDIKGFKAITDIHEHYRFYKTLGKGSFGEVLLAKHIKADVECAVKVVRKKNLEKQAILKDLMCNEMRVLEEIVRKVVVVYYDHRAIHT